MHASPHAVTPVDPARSLWAPVTIRVAWELVLAGVAVQPALIAEVREHVLRSLPAGLGVVEAEEFASVGVAEWLGRWREGRYRRGKADPDLSIPLTVDWRRRLAGSLTPVGDVVLRLHYGDGFPLASVARCAAVEQPRLEAARGGVRESVRIIAMEEGLSLSGWQVARVDALICRVARVAEPGCPGPGGLLTAPGRAHADRCPRCSRAVRLVRGGVLSPGDLFPPEGTSLRPRSRVCLTAILLHPDARRHDAAVTAALGGMGLAVGGDAWLVAQDDIQQVGRNLAELALAGTPARHHLRGAVVSGSGRWIQQRVIGPVAIDAIEAARARPWGEIMGLDELPAPLPPPPRATRWWALAAALVLAAVGACVWVSKLPSVAPSDPIQAHFTRVGPRWNLRFDTPDLAVIDVVARRGADLVIVHRGVRTDKGRWATGEGDYRLVVDGDEALIISSADGVPDLAQRVAASRGDPDPLASLSDRVRAVNPRVAVVRTPFGS